MPGRQLSTFILIGWAAFRSQAGSFSVYPLVQHLGVFMNVHTIPLKIFGKHHLPSINYCIKCGLLSPSHCWLPLQTNDGQRYLAVSQSSVQSRDCLLTRAETIGYIKPT